jgi:hypothetical protein
MQLLRSFYTGEWYNYAWGRITLTERLYCQWFLSRRCDDIVSGQTYNEKEQRRKEQHESNEYSETSECIGLKESWRGWTGASMRKGGSHVRWSISEVREQSVLALFCPNPDRSYLHSERAELEGGRSHSKNMLIFSNGWYTCHCGSVQENRYIARVMRMCKDGDVIQNGDR